MFESKKKIDASPAEEAVPASEADTLRQIGFWTIIAEDLRVHRREWSRAGFQALFVHRVGVYALTLPRLVRLPLDLFYAFGHRFCRSFYGIEIRRSAHLGRRLQIGHQHGIVLHDFLRMGDDCVIRQGVTFGIAAAEDWVPGQGPIVGNNVSVGVGAVIVGNVTIGDNVSIGPNCVVTADVPADRTLFNPPPRALPK